MSFKSKLMELVTGLPDDDEEPTGGGLREGDGPTDDASQVADGATDGGAADEGIDADIDEPGADADGAGDDNGDEGGLPEEDTPKMAALRASLVKLAQENERLRNRLAEMGGDAAATSSDLEADADEVDEDEVEVDEDQAQADIDEQEKQIAALRGDN